MLRAQIIERFPTPFGLLIWLFILIIGKALSNWSFRSIEKLPLALKNRVLKVAFLCNGAKMIESQYFKSKSRPYMFQTPGKQIFIVSSRKHIGELNQASPATLSMHAVAKELFQPMHTMMGFDMKEQRGVTSTNFVSAIRKDFTSRLPTMLPMLEEAIRNEFRKEVVNYKTVDGTYHVPLHLIATRLVARANCTACFGADFSSDPEVVSAIMEFGRDAFFAGEIIRAAPKWIALPIASLVTRHYRACKVLFDALCVTAERRRNLKKSAPETEIPVDGLQSIIDAIPDDEPWNPTAIAHEALGIFFVSVIGLTHNTAFALMDLCTHSEYTTPLRQELEESWTDFKHHAEGLPLLDSFIKESTRLSISESVSGRRKALAPFTFSNGPHVPTGSWIYIPTASINRDADFYPDPLRFDGFRFARDSPSLFTEVSGKWLLWGSGRVICPGRFYSSLIIKLVLVQMLCGYECELRDPEKPRTFMWRTTVVPSGDLTMILRPREKKNGGGDENAL